MNSRCQVDLIDMQAQPDDDYKFIMVYQDHLTKFVILRPLTHKRAEEVAYVLIDIFTTFGAPAILQSDNGREFANKVVIELCSMWEELKIVHGKPRHSQSQGSVERANQDIQNILATWLADNNSRKWSEGLKFVRFMKNRSFHHGTKRSPYEAMFGTRAKVGLKSTQIPTDLISTLKSEEDLEKALGCGINIENINEKHEKSDGSDKDSAKELFSDEDENDQIKLRIESISSNRSKSAENFKVQAKKMKNLSEERFFPGKEGENVKIKIPDVDRARCDLRCILGVILSVKDNLYEIGTNEGRLHQLYSQNQFTICKEVFIQADDVPPVHISREVARKSSNLGGQGYDRCTCIHCVRPTGVNVKDLVVYATQSVIIVVYVVINKVNK
ncbi:SCAN domain-containing protein 3-like [Rhopalosiphum maidis]|uniref:SCAN domain-containing protein 3-like n=1 Tax=Rhopalosiphum maidis TaxID=43146 RepID=UPI00101B8128|nr:SCAN domain-containing protein 3-like [Rhopalosiphum maidis]